MSQDSSNDASYKSGEDEKTESPAPMSDDIPSTEEGPVSIAISENEHAFHVKCAQFLKNIRTLFNGSANTPYGKIVFEEIYLRRLVDGKSVRTEEFTDEFLTFCDELAVIIDEYITDEPRTQKLKEKNLNKKRKQMEPKESETKKQKTEEEKPTTKKKGPRIKAAGPKPKGVPPISE
jgi:hypothetical protein